MIYYLSNIRKTAPAGTRKTAKSEISGLCNCSNVCNPQEELVGLITQSAEPTSRKLQNKTKGDRITKSIEMKNSAHSSSRWPEW